jgi:hypothetical protein
VDFRVDFAVAKSSFDHSLILITLTALKQEREPSNIHLNWEDFRHLLNERLTLNVFPKAKEDIEAAPSSSTVQYNGQDGMQCQNIQRHSRNTTAIH